MLKSKIGVLASISNQIRTGVFTNIYSFFPLIHPQLVQLFLKRNFSSNIFSIFQDKIDLMQITFYKFSKSGYIFNQNILSNVTFYSEILSIFLLL